MAVKSSSIAPQRKSDRTQGRPTGLARRFTVGANVIVTVGLALAVVMLANWFSQRYHYRRDLSTLGVHRLSERTRRVLDQATQPIRLTAIYTSDDPGKSRRKYLPRIQDLFEEMTLHNANLRTEIANSDDQKRELEKRVRESFAAQAEEHTKALDQANRLDNELTEALQNRTALLRQLRDAGAWIARFSSFTNITENLGGLSQLQNKTREEVDALISGQALPDYASANNKIKATHQQIRAVLTESKNWLDQMELLLAAVAGDSAPTVLELPARMSKLGELVEAIGETVGAPGDEMPDDPGESLKRFGQSAGELSTYLGGEIALLQSFADEYPVIVEHRNWAVQISLIGNLGARMELPTILRQEQQNLASLRPQIISLLSGNPEANVLRQALERVRNITRDMQNSLKKAAEVLTRLPEDLASVDAASLDLLNSGSVTATLTELIGRLDEEIESAENLPELELGTVGRDLTQDNAIVVESGNQVKVIRFDDVWPIEHEDVSIPGRPGEITRAFNGDSAVSAALLTLTQDKPVAAVVLAVFEPQVPPQMQRMARPPAGAYPAMYFDQLRIRLEDAHFVVQRWNLADEAGPPELEEEGLDRVYLVLSPLEYVVPSFGGQPGMTVPKLDDEKKQRLFDAIGEDGRAIFLCHYAPPQSAMMGMFGAGPVGQPRYQYDDYLQKNWGIDPQTQYRVLKGIPDPRRPGYWGVSGQSFAYMSISNFSSHPIGEPFRYRRMPMYNICPVLHAAETPEGVTVADILTVPPTDDIWGCQNIEDVIRAVLNPQSGGLVKKDLDPTDGFMDIEPPFPLIVAAENDKGGRVVVTGQAESVFDGYLNQPIPRTSTKDRISFEPPPTVNAELIVNAAYWVCGREELIGAGPVVTPVIGPLESSTRTMLSLAVTGWAFLVLVFGAVVMFARRK